MTENQFAGTPLLKALRSRCVFVDSEDETCVRDCLRAKKSCPEIEDILKKEVINKDVLDISSFSLLSSLSSLKLDAIGNAETKEKASIWYITRLDTAIRFIQLLLEYRMTLSNGTKETNSPSISEEEVNKMLVSNVQTLTGVILNCLDKSSANTREFPFNNDCTKAFDMAHLASFVFGSLLGLNEYVSSLPFFLAPLWKALCEIASHKNLCLPFELAELSLKSLADYITEGVRSTTGTLTQASDGHQGGSNLQGSSLKAVYDQLAFQAKVFSFLIGRVSCFLSILESVEDCEEVSTIFTKVCSALVPLCGLADVVEPSENQDKLENALKSYRQLATKVEKQILSFIFLSYAEQEKGTRTRRLEAFLQVEATRQNSSKLYKLSFSFGKAHMLSEVLGYANKSLGEGVVYSRGDVEFLLQTSRMLLFETLPIMSEQILWGKKDCMLPKHVQVISETLFLCETVVPAVSLNADPGRGRFHRLLVSWLMPSNGDFLHPLTSESVFAILQLHVWNLIGIKEDAALPLLTLCAELLVDARTPTGLRNNIATLLIRLYGHPKSHDLVQKLAVDSIRRVQRTLRPSSSTGKRKRSDKAPRYKLEDLKVIGLFASHVDGTALLDGIVPLPTESMTLDELEHICVQICILSGPDDNTSLERHLDFFMKLLSHWSSTTATSSSGFTLRLAWMGECTLRFCFTALTKSQSTSISKLAIKLCRFLSSCCATNGPLRTRKEFVPALLLAIKCLGAVGRFLQPDVPTSIAELPASVFHNLLASESWAIRSICLSSFITFASTIPQTHKSVLTKTVPTSMRSLLQCRLQNRWHGSTNDLVRAREGCNSALNDDESNQKRLSQMIFPDVSFEIIFPGSHVFTMLAGEEGIEALVVFPSHPKSLDVIKSMIGGQPMPRIGTLSGVETTSDGGCKLQLQS